MSDELSLMPLKKALTSLEDILGQPMNEYIRDGVIQRFEFTFELSWKMMKRYFKVIGREDLPAGPKPIIREAGKEGLIKDVEEWLIFLEKRNISTHIYNQEQAKDVYAKASAFPPFVQSLIKELNNREPKLK